MAPDVRVNAVVPGTVISGRHERLVGAENAQKIIADGGKALRY